MAWRYRFDNGDEQSLPVETTLYQVAAMAAFGREKIERLPEIRVGIHPHYDGHVVELWDRDMIEFDPPKRYGLGFNECGSLQLTHLVDTPDWLKSENK
jgi:hypothetical protein